MSLRNLPDIKAFQRPESLESLPTIGALDRWNSALIHAGPAEGTVINILDVIGEDYYGGGVTAASIIRQLAGASDVTVNINSPGGDYFEGAAIYSLFKQHKSKVTVNVLGMAASAASLIAMAGDRISIAAPASVMIHNAWTIALGDRHDMQDCVDVLSEIDAALRDVYVARTGGKAADIETMMDDETWLFGASAVEKGFADDILGESKIGTGSAKNIAAPLQAQRRVDNILAHNGVTKSERRKLFAEIKTGTSRAVDLSATSRAGLNALADDLRALRSTI